jgi:hypothetical protein
VNPAEPVDVAGNYLVATHVMLALRIKPAHDLAVAA